MSTTYNITEKTGYTHAHIPSSFEEARTFQDDRFRLDKTAAVAEANFIIRDAHTRYFRTIGLPEIGDDYSDEEELEWNTFFAQPHVQAELERLAEEAERQFAAGDTEEGGFAVE
jgi:hypothetical protein